MDALERWTGRLWIAAAMTSVVAFVLPGLAFLLILLGVFVITLPIAAFVIAAPTITLYLTVAGAIYLILRRWSRAGAAIAAATITVAVAIAVPMAANRAVSDAVTRFAATDRAGRVTIPRGATVAYLTDSHAGDDCEEVCQRLLFSGAAGAVLLGPLGVTGGAHVLVRHSVAASHDGACPPPHRSQVPAGDEDVGRDTFPRPALADSLVAADGTVRCQVTDRARLDAATIVVVHDNDWVGARRQSEWRLPAIPRRERMSVYVRDKGVLRLSVRQSFAAASRLFVPLWVMPPTSFDIAVPGQWATQTGEIAAGTRLPGSPVQHAWLFDDAMRVDGLARRPAR